MKAEDYKDLCGAVLDSITSLRSCLPDERPTEARILRHSLAELKQARLDRSNPKLAGKAANAIQRAEAALAEILI